MLAAGTMTASTDIPAVIDKLRKCRAGLAAIHGVSGLQQLAVTAIAEVAGRWQADSYPPRIRAQADPGVFPFSMVNVSLGPLLASLSEVSLEELIDAEHCRGVVGPEVIGHIIASNTPLLGWTSVIRALLVGSASVVKAPTSPNAVWLRYFVESLADVSPELAGLVALTEWPGSDSVVAAIFCATCDRVVVYGDDETIAAVEAVSRPGAVLGYGHRASVGFVLGDCDYGAAAAGFATDITTFDQGGCLSPQTIFVEGDVSSADKFAKRLADELVIAHRNSPARPQDQAAIIQEQRALAQFDPGTRAYGDRSLQSTVIARTQSVFVPSPGFGIVNIAPWESANLDAPLKPIMGKLQGAAISTDSAKEQGLLEAKLRTFGVSYICKPGNMQAPAISWRENNIDVLASLLLR